MITNLNKNKFLNPLKINPLNWSFTIKIYKGIACSSTTKRADIQGHQVPATNHPKCKCFPSCLLHGLAAVAWALSALSDSVSPSPVMAGHQISQDTSACISSSQYIFPGSSTSYLLHFIMFPPSSVEHTPPNMSFFILRPSSPSHYCSKLILVSYIFLHVISIPFRNSLISLIVFFLGMVSIHRGHFMGCL